MDSSHFSSMINDFKQGIFGALNEKKEELLKEGRKVCPRGALAAVRCRVGDKERVPERGVCHAGSFSSWSGVSLRKHSTLV